MVILDVFMITLQYSINYHHDSTEMTTLVVKINDVY